MISRRRLTFQLTPLLDMLLVVLFAQYMEMQDTSLREKNQLQAAALERERILENAKVELAETLNLAMAQQAVAGNLVAELFDVPESLIDQVLQPRAPAETIRSQAEIARLKQEFRELAQMRGRDVIKHLLTYEEITKRCDVWELYIQENGVIVFDTGAHRSEFRAETAAEFENALFTRYKSLSQPKSLVVILVSWGDARFGSRQPVLDGLAAVTDRMREDSNNRSRFEYAILGFQPRAEDSVKDSEP